MKISNIKESGANNVLMWAIANGAEIKEDGQIQSIINNETFYLVTLNDVNFFELFRLTQVYRNKVRILTEKQAAVPPRQELVKLFNGSIVINPENDPETKTPMYECVEHVVDSFINLALQMGNDDDIIKPSAVRLFLPMISRKFDVQIPVSFLDLTDSISADEARRLFTANYPDTLQDILDTENHGFKLLLQMGFIKGTSIIRYNQRYDQYLRLTRYTPLRTCNNNNLYKFGLLNFFKYDEATRGEVRCSMFNPNKEILGAGLKRLSRMNSPLHIEFAVQLPIQYMQMLENSFDVNVLGVNYESSMNTIIDDGIRYDDFITQELTDESEDVLQKFENHNNEINAYRVRIAECIQILLNSIPLLMADPEKNDVDETSVFSMLPAVYQTKAVITLNLDYADKYLNHYDPVIVAMFNEMLNMASGITENINNAK